MASRKATSNTSTDLLPPFVQQLIANQEVKYETNERMAVELYAAANNGMYPGVDDDYSDKDRYLRLAESLPESFKAYWDTDPNSPSNQLSYAIRMVDARAVFNSFANQSSDQGDKEWAVKQIENVGNYYESRAQTLGFTGDEFNSYAANSYNLSPEGWSAASGAGAIQPIQTPQTGMPDVGQEGTSETATDGSSEFNFDYSQLSGFDPTAYLRADSQRTIQDLEYQLTQYASSSFTFDIEGLSAPKRVPTGAEPVGGAMAPAGTTWSVTQTLQYPYLLTEKQVQDLQTTMSRAGYYRLVGRGYSQFGKVDEETAMAWGFLLADSVRNEQDPAQMLKQQLENYARLTAGNPMNVPYIDDSRIWEVARTAATEVIGRGLTDAELKVFTQSFRNWERDMAVQEFMGVDPEEQDIDLGARTNEYLRKRFEDESLATSVISTLDRYERLFNQ